MLPRLPDELSKNLSSIRIDRDAMSFIDDDDETPMIAAQCGEDRRQDHSERGRQIRSVGQRKGAQANGHGTIADAKRGRAVEHARSIPLRKPSKTGRDDPAPISLAPGRAPVSRTWSR